VSNGREQIEVELFGKHYVDKRNARELAAISAQSHALKWRGTAEELTATIARWFEAGWIEAESLQDAMQKASIHFAQPDGTSILHPTTIVRLTLPDARFRPLDEGYQLVEFDGKQYELTPTQSTVIRVLHKAHADKRASVGIKEIQQALHVSSGKMSGWFRRKNKFLYEHLIVQTATRQHYRLDL
jgi:hypothetical protein